MPQVKDVTLAFGSFSPIGGIFVNPANNIKVSFSVVFTPEETGQTYRVQIDLYEQRQDLTGSLERIRRIPDPCLTFTYGFIRKDHYLLVAESGEVLQEVEYFSNELNFISNMASSDRASQNQQACFYAVVTLYPDYIATSASSNIVTPKELGIGTVPTPDPIPFPVPRPS